MSTKPVIGKLYQYTSHSRWTRLQAVAVVAGVEFEHVKDYTVPMAMKDPEFLSKFPLGMLPAFESADGKLCITEASAIADYVAVSTPESGLMPTDPAEAAQVRMWLHICEAEIIAPLSAINRAHNNLVPWDANMADGLFQALNRRIANINHWVSTREYLVGGRFTLADLTLASVLGHGYAKFFDKVWQDKYPDALEYYKRILADPKLKGALGEPVLIEKTPEYKPKDR